MGMGKKHRASGEHSATLDWWRSTGLDKLKSAQFNSFDVFFSV